MLRGGWLGPPVRATHGYQWYPVLHCNTAFLQVLHILQYVQYWLLASIAHTMQYCNTDACGRDALCHESIRPVCATTCYNRHWGGFVGSVYEHASHGHVVFWVEHAFYFRSGESEERTCPGICNTTDTCMCNTVFSASIAHTAVCAILAFFKYCTYHSMCNTAFS